ncbi:odorant receptor 82a-like [Belonocnema kinseyi]|uniref:odorant receptor 82a-like n=1 Tax=Belonocnema kinseyi TaxID=2817044 RepID=UPI00143D84B4|nr:odorant receptor 82a-like [Belonocnema kinseyi]
MLWTNQIISRPMENFLRFISAWPGTSNAFLFPSYAILMLLSFIAEIGDACLVIENLKMFVHTISHSLIISLVFLKTTIFWLQRGCAKEILSEMLYDWCSIKNPEERIIMKKYVNISHKIYMASSTINVLSLCTYIGTFVRSCLAESVEDRKFPLPSRFPFPSKISPIFEVLCLLQLLILGLSATLCGALDSFFLAMILHTSTKIEIVRLELKRFVEDKLKSQNKSLASNTKNAAKLLIDKHQNMIDFAEKINQVYSNNVLVHFTFCMIQISFTSYEILTMLETNRKTVLKLIIILNNQIAVIGAFCAIGELVRSKSLSIADEAYSFPWYNLKTDDCRTIMMLIRRAHIPISITAGKFVILSIASFMQLLKATFSYLSVLRTIQQ